MSCDRCLLRAWLLRRLAGHLEPVRGRIDSLLALSDDELMAAIGGREKQALQAEYENVDLRAQREIAHTRGVETICRCQEAYPASLRDLDNAPAVLHVVARPGRLGELLETDSVAVVGTRRPSPYGTEVARSLGRGLASAGLTVVSGMAMGCDCAAHEGALQSSGATIAVLPGSADQPYPAARRGLHRRIVASGAVVSELPPLCGVWRWAFPARNRIIAGLASTVVVVEATERSGALLTARVARAADRPVGAVPGQITSRLAAGPNSMLATGAYVVRGAQDILDHLFGAGVRRLREERPTLSPDLAALLDAVAGGQDTTGALARGGFGGPEALKGLAELELFGYVKRSAGGRYAVTSRPG